MLKYFLWWDDGNNDGGLLGDEWRVLMWQTKTWQTYAHLQYLFLNFSVLWIPSAYILSSPNTVFYRGSMVRWTRTKAHGLVSTMMGDRISLFWQQISTFCFWTVLVSFKNNNNWKRTISLWTCNSWRLKRKQRPFQMFSLFYCLYVLIAC